jgi:hypothetical protein
MDLQKIRDYSIKKFDEEIAELQKYMDEDKDIALFVEKLFYGFGKNDISEEYNNDIDCRISEVLNRFIWSIWNTSPLHDLGNKYHFNGGWVYNLNNFIGNVFWDDAGFSISRDNKRYTKEWVVAPNTDDMFLQEPTILIAAAEDIAKYWIECEAAPDGKQKREILERGMISSGRVEALLKEHYRE